MTELPDLAADGTAHCEVLAVLARLRVVLPGLTEAEITAAILVLVEGLSAFSCVAGHDGEEKHPPWPDGKPR